MLPAQQNSSQASALSVAFPLPCFVSHMLLRFAACRSPAGRRVSAGHSISHPPDRCCSDCHRQHLRRAWRSFLSRSSRKTPTFHSPHRGRGQGCPTRRSHPCLQSLVHRGIATARAASPEAEDSPRSVNFRVKRWQGTGTSRSDSGVFPKCIAYHSNLSLLPTRAALRSLGSISHGAGCWA